MFSFIFLFFYLHPGPCFCIQSEATRGLVSGGAEEEGEMRRKGRGMANKNIFNKTLKGEKTFFKKKEKM